MKEIFSYTKLFTVLLAIFYIVALNAYYFNHVILYSFMAFLVLSSLVLFSKMSYKKILILCLIFFLGLIRAKQSLNLPKALDEFYSNDVTINGQIITSKNISHKNHKIKFFMRADEIDIFENHYNNLNTKFLVSIDETKNNNKKIVIGDYVQLKGKLRHPSEATNPYQFDYKRYLLNNDSKNILYADNIKVTRELTFDGNLKDKWYYVLKEFEATRNKIIEKHSKNIKSPNLEVLAGIVFGNETINPDEEIKESFKNSGLLHLLAASGLNVALIFGIWWWIATLIRFPYNLSILLGAVFVILYTFMTGFPPSILRASLMLLFVLLGKIIDRNTSSVALIFFVAFLILLFSPKMIFDVGFQLSFVVTLGLVVCCPQIIEKFKKIDEKYKNKYKDSTRFTKYVMFLFSPINVVSIIIVPLFAQLFVIPLQMHYFNTFTPFSILANIMVVPFIGILSFIGFISSIIALIPNFSDIFVNIFDFISNPIISLLIRISELFSNNKYSIITTYAVNIFQIFAFWLLILLFVLNIKHNFSKKDYKITFLVVMILFLTSFIQIDKFKNNLEIMMFDVQNADSFLIKTPKNKYIMIDTGKKSFRGISDASMIMNKYLKNKRVKELEVLIVTHFDMDHCAGVIDILENTHAKLILIQTKVPKSQLSAQILNYLEDNKLNYKIANNNEIVYQEANLTLKTLVPNYAGKKDIENETSVVSLLSYNGKNALFTGDSGVVGYNTIKKYLPNKINVLKVGHHGAKSSINSQMLDEIKPNVALISAGIGKFNHPHYSTLRLLSDKNIKYVSTKSFGFIKLDLKNDEIYYFDKDDKRIKKLIIDKPNNTQFCQNEYVQELVVKEKLDF